MRKYGEIFYEKKKEQQARRKRKSIETRRADNIEILNCK
jgi:hypothetical protein